MKLHEIAKQLDERGTYVGARLDDESKDKIVALIKRLGVENAPSTDSLHSTIIYSRKYAPTLKANSSLYPMFATPKTLHIFKTRDKKNALVLKINCPKLVDRHTELMSEYDLTYDFSKYIPHITLSYDSGDFDPKNYDGKLPDLYFVKEYVEDLDLNWKPEN